MRLKVGLLVLVIALGLSLPGCVDTPVTAYNFKWFSIIMIALALVGIVVNTMSQRNDQHDIPS